MREISNAELDREVIRLDAKRKEPRIKLVPFDKIQLGADRRYLVKGIIPYPGLSVIWGPPKSGKSFWAFDLVMRVALGWEYRGRRVHQGPVVYCCFEGQTGIRARAEAFRQKFLGEDSEGVPFFLQPVTIDLVKEHEELTTAIRAIDSPPVAVVLDTLNRSLAGSESSDTDMSNYVRAADAIRDAFGCAVLIVHHCGINDSRPRGHTSLTGAADAQIAVRRDINGNLGVTVEFMKDGEAGQTITSKLESVEVGTDEDGEAITSCVVVEADQPIAATAKGPRLTPNQSTMLAILRRAGRPLTAEEWTDQAKEAGLSFNRAATYWDLRRALQDKGLVYEGANGWLPK
jgi:AAA domain-containing protein